MKSILFKTIGIWMIWSSVVIVSAVTKSLTIIPQTSEPNHKLTYTVLTLDLTEPTTEHYLEFITALRTALRINNHLVCKLPVLKQTARDNDERFVLVNLKIESSRTITIGIDVLDLYVVGYQDKLGTHNRANFLKEIPKVAITHLFPGSVVRHIGFTGHYSQLERQAGDRGIICLGLLSLQAAANAIYGEAKPKGKDEAKFLIIAIEMISEAVRFEYIAKQIQPYESTLPDSKILKLENSWESLSKGIVGARDCGDFPKPIDLVDADNKRWTVSKVSEIVDDMGILKHISNGVQAS